jgi:hypothetical protein
MSIRHYYAAQTERIADQFLRPALGMWGDEHVYQFSTRALRDEWIAATSGYPKETLRRREISAKEAKDIMPFHADIRDGDEAWMRDRQKRDLGTLRYTSASGKRVQVPVYSTTGDPIQDVQSRINCALSAGGRDITWQPAAEWEDTIHRVDAGDLKGAAKFVWKPWGPPL